MKFLAEPDGPSPAAAGDSDEQNGHGAGGHDGASGSGS